MLESKLERDICKNLAAEGLINVKLFKARGWPDRLFLKAGRVLFVEFKAEGKSTRKYQEYIHKLLREAGFTVYVVDDYAGEDRIRSYF